LDGGGKHFAKVRDEGRKEKGERRKVKGVPIAIGRRKEKGYLGRKVGDLENYEVLKTS